MDSQYKELTKLIRKLVAQEIKTGKYPHLRNPNRRSSLPEKRDHDFFNEQFKTTYKFTEELNTQKGKRNLDIGKVEVFLEFHGNVQPNYKNGFNMNQQSPLRIVTGNYMDYRLKGQIHKYQLTPLIDVLLRMGNYEEFVQESLHETNKEIGMCKSTLKKLGLKPKYPKKDITIKTISFLFHWVIVKSYGRIHSGRLKKTMRLPLQLK